MHAFVICTFFFFFLHVSLFKMFRLFRLLAYLNYTRRTPLHARSPVIFHSRTRLVARVPSTANSLNRRRLPLTAMRMRVVLPSVGAIVPVSRRLRPRSLVHACMHVAGPHLAVAPPSSHSCRRRRPVPLVSPRSRAARAWFIHRE